jgi:hypothetical protein
MTNLHAIGQGSALLATGTLLLAMVAIRTLAGSSLTSHASFGITRAGDPFGFWLGVAVPAAFGLALCLIALAHIA